MLLEVRTKSSKPVVPHTLGWRGRVAAGLIYAVAQLVAATLRYRLNDPQGVLKDLKGNAVFCTWHNRLAVSLPVYNRFLKGRQPGCQLAALVSASKDGGLLAQVLEYFGVQPVRGSSSRRGPQALLELTTWAEKGYDMAITPDGPRGPKYVVQDGVMALAQLTGLSIVPMSWTYGSKISLKSWDQFQIPFPFTRCEISIGKPLTVPRGMSDSERAELRADLGERIKALGRD